MSEQAISSVTLTRELLYERVWTTAMRNLAREFGISDVGLKKVCRRFEIPTPPVGYWAQKAHGKAPRRPKLPRSDRAGPVEITIIPTRAMDRTDVCDVVEGVVDREKAPENRIIVRDDVDSLLPLVEKTRASLMSARPDERGLVQPRAKKILDIHVSRPLIDRACRIADALLRSLEVRGIEVQLAREDDQWRTVATVLGEQVLLQIYEVVDRVEREPTPAEHQRMEKWTWHRNEKFYRDVATGRLCLGIPSGPMNGRRRRFVDTKRRQVESMLNVFVTTLYRTAEDIKIERARLEKLQRDREEAERKRQDFERQRIQKMWEIREEEERVAALLARADAWSRSEALRRFIDAVREAAIHRDGRIEEGSDADRWLQWATDQADRLDPLFKSPPSILDEKAKWGRY